MDSRFSERLSEHPERAVRLRLPDVQRQGERQCYTLPWISCSAASIDCRRVELRADAVRGCTGLLRLHVQRRNGRPLGSTTVFATPYAAYSLDKVSVIDLRLEKSFRVAKVVKVRLFVDGFNLTNRYAAETISVATGSAFQKPTGILAPRTGRVGST